MSLLSWSQRPRAASTAWMLRPRWPAQSAWLRAWPWLHVAQLGALTLLVLVFLAWVVARQVAPFYGWIAGTPAEKVGRWWGPVLRHQAMALAVPASTPAATQMAPSLAEVVARMDQRRPTHLVVLRDGRRLFGTLRQVPGATECYTIQVYEGETMRRYPLTATELDWRQTLVIPPATLSADDKHFLMLQPYAHHFLLPPYLFATTGDFAPTHDLYASLNALSNEFRQTFAPLLVARRDPGSLIHVRLVTSQSEWQAEISRRGWYGLVNANGFYAAADNCLYVFAPDGRRLGKYSQPQPQLTVTRHEAAHQLADTLRVAPLATTPWWVTEGIAQACEAAPIGDHDVARLRLLAQGRRDHTLLPWSEVMELTAHGCEGNGSRREQMAYAQAWWLCHYGLSHPMRAKFYKYLAQITQPAGASDEGQAMPGFMAAMELTPAMLMAAFDADLRPVDADCAELPLASGLPPT